MAVGCVLETPKDIQSKDSVSSWYSLNVSFTGILAKPDPLCIVFSKGPKSPKRRESPKNLKHKKLYHTET